MIVGMVFVLAVVVEVGTAAGLGAGWGVVAERSSVVVVGRSLVVVAEEDRWVEALGGSRCVVGSLVVSMRERKALVVSQLEDRTIAAAAAAATVVDGGDESGAMALPVKVVADSIGSFGRVVVALAKHVGEWHSSRWLPWWNSTDRCVRGCGASCDCMMLRRHLIYLDRMVFAWQIIER